MKQHKKPWLTLGWLALTVTLLAQNPTTMSVQVKNGQLRATPSYLGKLVTTLNYGDRLQVVEQQGEWSKATAPGGQTGWIHRSALTKKKIVMKAGETDAQSAASTEELALAGKGFNADVEADFKAKNQSIDFTWVDKMETFMETPEAMQQFLKDGGVQPK